MSLLRKKIKCCFIGKFGAGKTSFIRSILGLSTKDVQTTLGIDFFTTSISVKGMDVYVTFWDTAGSERFQSLMHSYLRDSDIVFVLYDITDRTAMASVAQCFCDVEQSQPKVVAVVGNKTDLKPLFIHDVHSTIAPWLRQDWNIVTATCSVKKVGTAKKILRHCLNIVIEPPNVVEQQAAHLRLQPRPSSSQKCCT